MHDPDDTSRLVLPWPFWVTTLVFGFLLGWLAGRGW